LEEVLKAQRSAFPNGLLGNLLPTKMVLENVRPSEVEALLDKYLAGKMSVMKFATLMESVKMRLVVKPVNSNTLMLRFQWHKGL
jgi:hypothetical protein